MLDARIIIRTLTITLLSVLCFCGCSKKDTASVMTAKFTEMAKANIKRLEQQRAIIAAVAKQRYGTATLTKTKADITILQQLLDDKAFSKTQTYELQCLGVVFGDILISELPLHWVIVTDEYGTDPTLQYKTATVQINALTMISKRVEKDENVNVSGLLDKTRQQLLGMAGEIN